VIRLVTPIHVRTSLGVDSPTLAVFGILELTVVPEPATGVLVAGGAALLVGLGRRARAGRRRLLS
jgi:hypothetical protein